MRSTICVPSVHLRAFRDAINRRTVQVSCAALCALRCRRTRLPDPGIVLIPRHTRPIVLLLLRLYQEAIAQILGTFAQRLCLGDRVPSRFPAAVTHRPTDDRRSHNRFSCPDRAIASGASAIPLPDPTCAIRRFRSRSRPAAKHRWQSFYRDDADGGGVLAAAASQCLRVLAVSVVGRAFTAPVGESSTPRRKVP